MASVWAEGVATAAEQSQVIEQRFPPEPQPADHLQVYRLRATCCFPPVLCSVSCGTVSLFELANEERQRHSDERDHAQDPETVEECQHRRLLLHYGVDLG